MKSRILLMLFGASLLFASCGTTQSVSQKQANTETEQFRYELECAGNGAQGTYLVKVYSYSKKPNVAAEQCKKNAVHGIIFKGFTGMNGCVSQPALVKNPGAELEHRAFFEQFFKDGGEYMKYVSVSGKPQELLKVGREYKVGLVVVVHKDALRKALEQAGVVRSLNSLF